MSLPARSWTGVLVTGAPVDPVTMDAYLDELADILDPAVEGIKNENVATGADISGSKLAALSIVAGKYAAASIDADDIANLAIKEAHILRNDAAGIRGFLAQASQRLILYGASTISVATWGTAASNDSTVLFTAAHDYVSGFGVSTEITVIATIQTDTDRPFVARIHDVTQTQFECDVYFSEVPGTATISDDLIINWMAFGRAA